MAKVCSGKVGNVFVRHERMMKQLASVLKVAILAALNKLRRLLWVVTLLYAGLQPSFFDNQGLSQKGGQPMYSPKIRDDLIPRIYQEAKRAGLAMTTWVNQALEQALPQSRPAEQQNQQIQKKESNYE